MDFSKIRNYILQEEIGSEKLEAIYKATNSQGYTIYKSDKKGYRTVVVDGVPREVKIIKPQQTDQSLEIERKTTQFKYKDPGTTRGAAFKAKIQRMINKGMGHYAKDSQTNLSKFNKDVQKNRYDHKTATTKPVDSKSTAFKKSSQEMKKDADEKMKFNKRNSK